MDPLRSGVVERCLAEIRSRGMLLAADTRLPSVTAIGDTSPAVRLLRKHPKAALVREWWDALDAHPEVLAVRLVSSKITYVHRALWSDVLALGISRARWQTEFLPPSERALLDIVDREFFVRIDTELGVRLDAHVASLGGTLESRLLVLGGHAYLASRAPIRTLTSWRTWAARVDQAVVTEALARRGEPPERLDAAARALGPTAWLPWWRQPRRRHG